MEQLTEQELKEVNKAISLGKEDLDLTIETGPNSEKEHTINRLRELESAERKLNA